MLMCPVCEAGLRTITRHGAEIDYCNHCRGVWLDCRELDEIVARIEEANHNLPSKNASHHNTLHNMARRNYRGAWREHSWNDEPGRLDGGELPQDSYSRLANERHDEDDRYYSRQLYRSRNRRDAFERG